MTAIPCSRPPPPPPACIQWCVADELTKTHAVTQDGISYEYMVLESMGIKFRPGIKIRHRNGNTLDNCCHNLAIELEE